MALADSPALPFGDIAGGTVILVGGTYVVGKYYGDDLLQGVGDIGLPNTWFSEGDEEGELYEPELDFGGEFEGLTAGEISEKYLRGKGTPFKKWLGQSQEGAARALDTEPSEEVTDTELKAYHEVAKQALENPSKDTPLQHDRLKAIEKWLRHRGY